MKPKMRNEDEQSGGGDSQEHPSSTTHSSTIYARSIKEYKFWLSLISGLVGGISVVSLIQKFFHVGLVPILFDFMTYYRKLFYSIFDVVFFWLPFHVPDFYKDLLVISLIFTSAFVKVWLAVLQSAGMERKELTKEIIVTLEYSIVLLTSLVGAILPVLFLLIYFYQSKEDRHKLKLDPFADMPFGFGQVAVVNQLIRDYGFVMACMGLSATIFFALNGVI